MPNADLRNVFGLAMTAIYARSLQYSASTTNKMCQAVAQGFGLSTSDGDTIYTYFNTESRPDSSAVFTSTPYTTYEIEVQNILSSYLPTASVNQIALLSIAAHAVIFGYAVNQSVNITDFQKVLGTVLKEVSIQVLENQFFVTKNEIVINPFNDYGTLMPLIQNDYTQTIVLAGRESKNIEVPLTNYNWYDASKLFKEPDLQIMKDVESQYYYFSGQMLFESAFGAIENCIEDQVTINTYTGDATFTYYRNTPCKEVDTYIGPPNSILFNRIFNDGPSSSGYFNSGLSGFYIQNDKAMLSPASYSSNTKNLVNLTGGALSSNVPIDTNGEYSLLKGDYLNAPYSFNCTEPYQRLHIGDNKARYICNPVTCVCTLRNVTGFKYAALSLPDNDSTSDWQFRQTNPLSSEARLLSRALNIADNPYWATDVGGVLYPYIQDVTAPFTQYWTIGYPVLGTNSTLPELAFFQTFDNPTFGDSPSVAIFPSIAVSNGSVGDNADSDRTYSVGSKMLFSGGGSLPVRFNTRIASNLSGYDQITQKFFGMGTAFSGKYNISVSNEENAGFNYSGLVVSLNGAYVNTSDLADSFLESTVGRKYKTVKYISGYRRLSDGQTFGLSSFFAKDGSGTYYTYSYFNQSDVPMINLKQAGWSYFAPTPTELENTSVYERVYSEQVTENYLPRFYDGPFSQENRRFLYPNANAADKIYGGKTNGIPKRVHFKLNIREEVVKEIYARYTIYPDGTISDNPELVPVIRSDVLGKRTENPKMTNIFLPNDVSERFDYDFNNFGPQDISNTSASLPDLVDKNWAPLFVTGTDSYVIPGRNNTVYGTYVDSLSLFNMGLKKQTDDAQQHLFVDVTGGHNVFYSPRIIADALFRTFQFTALTGSLEYALPIFDLNQDAMIVNQGMVEAFPDSQTFNGLEYTSFDGFTSGIDSGLDPLFLEIIGGRRGSEKAIADGGYHSKDIIGDKWMGMVYDTFGTKTLNCFNGVGLSPHTFRYPKNDAKLALFNSDASGTDIWVNGMSFAPYRIIRNVSPLTISSIPFSKDNVVSQVPATKSGQFIKFNLGAHFPLRNRTGDASVREWYFKSGLRVGPFDRDVELGITRGEKIIAYSELYIDGKQLSHWFIEGTNCDRDWVQNISIGTFVAPGEPFYTSPRNGDYSILSVIPSGKQANINILSDITNGIDGDPAMNYIGMPSGAIITLRTHVPLDTNAYSPMLHSGEQGRLESFGYVNNGVPTKYRINHSSFEDMAGIKEFINYGYSGKLYPKPDETAFRALSTTDKYGNVSYASGVNTETYWRSYAMKNNQRVHFSGYREGSRISFEILDVEIENDVPPYQAYNLIVPSGACILSGEMGYYAQADNAIFSEGLYLTNTTLNDDFVETYNPSYVSDVLRRVPSGLFQFPVTQSGSGQAPVLIAPSVMKQREYVSGISDGQRYSYLLKQPPYSYNKLLWPALSDLETLNAGETMESIPPGDGETFSNSTMMFSACQGQTLPNGLANPVINKKYGVQNIFQFYDSVTTDALINSSKCLTSGRGVSVELAQNSSLSGALVARGTPLTLVIKGLV